MVRRNIPTALPIWEQGLYWLIECMTIFYMLYSLYHASEDARRENEPIEIEEGWSFIGRPKDTADFEWEFWSSFFVDLVPWICGHVILSCTLAYCDCPTNTKAVLCTLYSLLALSYLLGFWIVMLLCVQPVILFVVSQLGSVILVWLTTLLFLTVLNFCESTITLWLHNFYAGSDFSAWFYVCVFVWANLCQRSTAFALERVWAQHSRLTPVPPTSEKMHNGSEVNETAVDSTCIHSVIPNPLLEVPGWIDMFFYVFYFPLFFTGPLIIYNKFHRQLRDPQPCIKERLQNIVLRLLSIMFWAVMNHMMLHFIYAHAINSNSTVLAQQSCWTTAAIGYVLGQFFMMKYLVLFGLPAQLARLDGFEPPAVPACISYIYCYSDMWKSFDRGLYDFMKRYIFIPCGGSRAGLGRQILGSVLCFAFVFYWHGAEYFLFLWCVLNFIETSLEQIGAWLENTALVKRHFYDKLSPAGKRRMRAVMSVPLFLMSVFAIFYFFGGTGSGIVFLRKLLIDIPWSSLAVFLTLVYCAVQNAMEIERLGLAKLNVSRHRD